ncbi:MAG: preprotein translocase subunit SecG [Verrucomicrobiota bacterium]|jgi:protein translocase SecG subunit
MLSVFIVLVTILLVVVCLLLIVLVLMQRPKQEGLGAAFGAGVTDQIWGSQTTNVLQKGTVYLGVLFFVLSLLLAILKAREAAQFSNLNLPKTAPVAEQAPVAPAAPVEIPAPAVNLETPTPAVPVIPATTAPAVETPAAPAVETPAAPAE